MKTESPAAWSTLLSEAVTKPGLMLDAYRAFHNYSVGNQLLAIVQLGARGIPPAPINTYPGWLSKGRQVKKGERALVLCQPITFKDKADPEARRLGFMYKARWFALSQTEGEDIAPIQIPEWSKLDALFTLDVEQMPYEITSGNIQGYAVGRWIAINPLAQLPHKTLFHELGHVIRHRQLDFPVIPVHELEAREVGPVQTIGTHRARHLPPLVLHHHEKARVPECAGTERMRQ